MNFRLPHGIACVITPIARLDIHTLRDFAAAERGYMLATATPLCYVCRDRGAIPYRGRGLCVDCISYLTIQHRWKDGF